WVGGRPGRGGEGGVEVKAPAGGIVTLPARQAVVLAVGSTASTPPIPGLAEPLVWTSREATSAETVPGRLAIIGGGVVACEMATAWRGVGAAGPGLVGGGRVLGKMGPVARPLGAGA